MDLIQSIRAEASPKMEGTLTAIDWERIENFIGFGNVNAPVVFIGMEEGLSREDALETDLIARSKYDQVMDLYEAQTSLGGPGRYFGRDAKSQPTWRPMCHLMLRHRTEEPLDKIKRVRYQADELGRLSDDSLLCELMPYPSPKTNSWLYSRFDRFANRDDYNRNLLSNRMELLRSVLIRSSRELVVCYGKQDWPHFERLAPNTEWRDDGIFRIGADGSTRFVLAPHFSSEYFNTESQLEEFSRVSLAK